MALVGKWTKIEQVQSETETEKVKIEYPAELPEGDPDFDKAGTTEEIEVPKIDIIETVFDDVYVVVHSINSWKQPIKGNTKSLFNICYRVYKSKDERLNDYNSFIYENHLTSQSLDYSINQTDMEQAYNLVNILRGFEKLIKD